MRTQNRALLALALAALLVTSSVGAVAVGTSSLSDTSNSQEQEIEPADEIYVEDDGDAVLIYRDDATDSGTGHYGADLSEGLFHVFVNDTMEEPPEDDFSGEASFELGPGSMSGDGAFSMDAPDTIEDLTFDASAEQTRDDSQASLSFDGTFTSESGTADRGTSMLESVSTEGSVNATFAEDPGVDDSSFAFTLEEREDAYVLSGEQDYVVGEYNADSWNTAESAQRSIEAQFGVVARQLDGDVAVTVDSHSFDESTNRVDVSYTVEFTGVDEAVSERLASSLAESRELDLSESEADDLADRIQSVELTELSASLDVTAEEANAEWSVRIDEWNEAATAALDVAEASEMGSDGMTVEEARTRLEAQQAADLQRTVSWSGSLSSPGEDTADVEFEADYSTENWGSYVDELESRDVEWPGSTEFEASARTEDGELTAEMSATVSREGLVDQAVDGLLESSEDAGSERARSLLEAFRNSEFETAKMDVSVEDRTVSFEAGASFDNVSAFRDVMGEEYGDDLRVASAYGELDDGESVTYVRLSGAVSEDASESDVRALSVVGEDTAVNMPDDWDPDEEEFPEMDTQEARNYLDVDDDGGPLAGMPGFGPAVALVALIALALFGRRRSE